MAQLSLRVCDYNKQTKRLSVASEFFAGGFPREIEVESHFTGAVVSFRPVGPEHPDFDEDQWDGEQMVYAPIVDVPNVRTLTVYHQW